MPFARITLAGTTLNPGKVADLQAGITGLLETILRKRPELTAVLVEEVAVAGWAIAGRPAQVAGHIDVKVTAGTNTADEKADFIEAAAGLLRAAVGPLTDPATYVVIHELASDAWGYDGVTQEQRRYRS